MNLFLDTTVLVEVLLKPDGEIARDCKRLIAEADHSRQHLYVVKEFLQGPFRNHVLVHNWIVTQGLAAAHNKAKDLFHFQPRKGSTATEFLTQAFQNASNSTKRVRLPVEQVKDATQVVEDQIRLYMRQTIISAWSKRLDVAEEVAGESLDCFPHTELKKNDVTGQLTRDNPFGCSLKGDMCCQAALSMSGNVSEAKKLMVGARKSAPKKLESRKRITVLKKIAKGRPRSLTQKDCRSLGDAAIIHFCPSEYAILTTNYTDFKEMGAEVGRSTIRPTNDNS